MALLLVFILSHDIYWMILSQSMIIPLQKNQTHKIVVGMIRRLIYSVLHYLQEGWHRTHSISSVLAHRGISEWLS